MRCSPRLNNYGSYRDGPITVELVRQVPQERPKPRCHNCGAPRDEKLKCHYCGVRH